MHLVRSLALAGLLVSLVGCRSDNSLPQQNPQVRAPIRIQLDGSNPAASEGVLDRAEGPLRFTVGHGRHGIACEGTTFEVGITPLGTFQVNAILSKIQHTFTGCWIAAIQLDPNRCSNLWVLLGQAVVGTTTHQTQQ